MEQDAHLGAQPQSDSAANDRLRKAIERNRAKQAKRASQPQQPQTQSRPRAAHAAGDGQESLMDRLKAARAAGQQASSMGPPDLPGGLSQKPRSAVPPRPARTTAPRGEAQAAPSAARVRRASAPSEEPKMSLADKLKAARRAKAEPVEEENERSWGLPGLGKKKKAASAGQDVEVPVATRKTVAKADSVEFTTALRKSPRKAPANVGYTTAKRKVKTKNKSKNLQNNAISYLVKGAWAFCFFLLLRLIFSEGGIVDYYASQSLMNDKLKEYQDIQKENVELGLEIDKIRTNRSYQKKLVRDNLGFIAKDEYLILFPKSKKMTSI